MTVLQSFLRMKIDRSLLGLEKGPSRGGYFCTPVGAKVFAWAGVDGIHYCTVPECGDMIFAVDPFGGEGRYLRPLAANCEDFLRLLLACGSADVMEQAVQFDTQADFEQFMAENTPGADTQSVLEKLRETFGLSPMEHPWQYIQALCASFEESALRFPKEYYEETEAAPEETYEGKPWAVYFEGDFSIPCHRRDHPGTEQVVNKTFLWGEEPWQVPAIYLCGKGLVVDFCVQATPQALRALEEQWVSFGAVINGREQGDFSGTILFWDPNETDHEPQDRWVLEHYGLDLDSPWMIQRISFPWVTKTKPKLRTLSFLLSLAPKDELLCQFTTTEPGQQIPFTNPLTQQRHVLTVERLSQEKLETPFFPEGDTGYPLCCTQMAYRLSPDIPKATATDRNPGDRPRPAQRQPEDPSTDIIGGCDGPTVLFHSIGQPEEAGLHFACSNLRFRPVGQVAWQLTCPVVTREAITIPIPL